MIVHKQLKVKIEEVNTNINFNVTIFIFTCSMRALKIGNLTKKTPR